VNAYYEAGFRLSSRTSGVLAGRPRSAGFHSRVSCRGHTPGPQSCSQLRRTVRCCTATLAALRDDGRPRSALPVFRRELVMTFRQRQLLAIDKAHGSILYSGVTTDARLSICQKTICNPTRATVVTYSMAVVSVCWVGPSSGGSNFGADLSSPTRVRQFPPQFDGLRALARPHVMVDHFSADVPNFPLPDWISRSTCVRPLSRFERYFIPPRFGAPRDRIEAASISSRSTLGGFYWRRYSSISPAYFAFAPSL